MCETARWFDDTAGIGEELVCVKWRSNVQIMEEGCKILYLSVFWIALKVLL